MIDESIVQERLKSFLERWPISKVEEMKLSEYVNVGNPETFVQSVETYTRRLGSIKGQGSIKFGIYKRKNKRKLPKRFNYDNEYNWDRKFGKNRNAAFKNIKSMILNTIKAANNYEFSKIEDIPFNPLFKWKIASLYSGLRICPIFKRETLWQSAKKFDNDIEKDSPYYILHEILIENKPAGISPLQFADELYNEVSEAKNSGNKKTKPQRAKGRKGINKDNGDDRGKKKKQKRKGFSSYEANQKHDFLRDYLAQQLREKYGSTYVEVEENYVDVKLKLKNEIVFYEIKTASYVDECFKQGLGQVIGYVYRDEDKRKKKIKIASDCELTSNEKVYIKFLQKLINLPIDYEQIIINENE